jgi:hypothetical protein
MMTIATHPDQLPVPNWHREILNERVAAYRENLDSDKSWEEVETEILE